MLVTAFCAAFAKTLTYTHGWGVDQSPLFTLHSSLRAKMDLIHGECVVAQGSKEQHNQVRDDLCPVRLGSFEVVVQVDIRDLQVASACHHVSPPLVRPVGASDLEACTQGEK